MKFRQAPLVTHLQLTSVRSMASFRGERPQTHPPLPGLRLPPKQWVPKFPTLLGFGDVGGRSSLQEARSPRAGVAAPPSARARGVSRGDGTRVALVGLMTARSAADAKRQPVDMG